MTMTEKDTIDRFDAWITSYALTGGIKLMAGEVSQNYPDMFCCVSSDTNAMVGLYFHGNNWHRTSAAALARAEQMRKGKIISLQKSIAKMEALKFSLPE